MVGFSLGKPARAIPTVYRFGFVLGVMISAVGSFIFPACHAVLSGKTRQVFWPVLEIMKW